MDYGLQKVSSHATPQCTWHNTFTQFALRVARLGGPLYLEPVVADIALTIALAVGWLGCAVRLGLDLAGRTRARPGYRWMLASLLIMVAGTLALEILADLNRPFGQRQFVARIVLILAVPSAALLLIGIAIWGRWRSAD